MIKIIENQIPPIQQNNSSNNRYNCGDRNEISFWKVFSNLFLLKYILKMVCKDNGWELYSDLQDFYERSNRRRIKFKEITSFEWMVTNEQYQLLKYKINKVNDEYIELNEEGLKLFFKQYSKLVQLITLNSNRTIEEKEFEKTKLKIEIIVEIFKLLLSKRRLELEVFDFTKLAIQCDSMESLKLLSDNSYPIIVSSSTIEYVISNYNIIPFQLTYEISSHAKNIQILKKLLELNVISKIKRSRYEKFGYHFRIDHSFEDLLGLLTINFKLYCEESNDQQTKLNEKINEIKKDYSNHGSDDTKLKELQKLIIIQFKSVSLYKNYIIKYNETFDEFHDDGIKSNDYANKNEKRLLSLFRYFSISSQYFRYKDYNQELKDILDGVSKDTSKYDVFLDAIEIRRVCFYLEIKSQEFLDWLLNCETLIFLVIETFGYSIFSNIQLLRIANRNDKLKQLIKLSSFMDNQSCTTEFYKLALEEIGFDVIIKDLHTFISDYPIPDERLIILIDFLNEHGYQGFKKEYFCELLAEITSEKSHGNRLPSQSYCGRLERPINYISRVIVDLNDIYQTEKEITQDLFDTIISKSFKTTEFFVNHIDIIRLETNQLKALENQFEIFNEIYYKHDIDHDINEINSIIKIFVGKFNKRNLNGYIMLDGEFKSYQTIFNFYFSLLITNGSIKLDDVLEIYQLLKNIGIEIKHTIFHSYWYLSIRNEKFIKYIKLGSSSWKGMKSYPCIEYLNIKQFTFEYILGGSFNQFHNCYCFNNTFDQVLNQLVSSYSNLQDWNRDLRYFLEIDRIDLFFSHLEIIQQQLINFNNNSIIQPQRDINHSEVIHEEECYDEECNDEKCNFIEIKSSRSASTLLLPTSKIFKNSKPPIKLFIASEIWKKDLIHPCSTIVHSFEFSNIVMQLAVYKMDIESIQSLIEFNYYADYFLNTILEHASDFGRYDICKFIMDNFNIELNPSTFNDYKFLFDTYPNQSIPSRVYNRGVNGYCTTIEMSFINLLINHLSCEQNNQSYELFQKGKLQNHPNFIEKLLKLFFDHCDIETDQDSDESNQDSDESNQDSDQDLDEESNKQPMETKQTKKNNLKLIISQDINLQNVIKSSLDKYIAEFRLLKDDAKEKFDQYYGEFNSNPFNQSFGSGNIQLCNLIKSFQPNYFKITKYSIDYAFPNHINIIKYYYKVENCLNLINNFQSDNQHLSNYLKELLLNNGPSKFDLNWL
ncbi:hypothetical protein ACTA71_009330 [Dictyostelium dimigraforme]